MTYREYATMDRLMQGIIPAPVEYIAEELGGEKFKTVCDDIYAVLKENELSVEQAEVKYLIVVALKRCPLHQRPGFHRRMLKR